MDESDNPDPTGKSEHHKKNQQADTEFPDRMNAPGNTQHLT